MTIEQEKVYIKLSYEWKTPYDLQESSSILDELVNKGLANKLTEQGSCYMKRKLTKYQKS